MDIDAMIKQIREEIKDISQNIQDVLESTYILKFGQDVDETKNLINRISSGGLLPDILNNVPVILNNVNIMLTDIKKNIKEYDDL